jgi:PAS domain S-box-containing protein
MNSYTSLKSGSAPWENLGREQCQSFFSLIPDLACICSADGYFSYLNPAWEETLGYPKEELLRRRFSDLVHPEDKTLTSVRMRQRARFVNRYRCRDGSYRWFEWNTAPNPDGTETFAIAREVTDLVQAQQALLAHQEQLRLLAVELSAVEERERRRIATELHDEIGQALALAKIKLHDNFCADQATTGCARRVQDVSALVEKTIQAVRTLTFQISPPLLYEVGLEAAVEWLSEQFEAEHGLRIIVDCTGSQPELGEELSSTLYHVVRELLVNVVKHAGARTVTIALRQAADRVELTVKDDGSGFVLPAGVERSGGFGLFNIRQRIQHLGGVMEMATEPGQGVEVALAVPVASGGQQVRTNRLKSRRSR